METNREGQRTQAIEEGERVKMNADRTESEWGKYCGNIYDDRKNGVNKNAKGVTNLAGTKASPVRAQNRL